MKFDRLVHSPDAAADFYEEALTRLGALCERTWHDRLEIVAQDISGRLWNEDGALHEVELWFPPPEDTAPRESVKEVFPGCPLTFRLAEALRPSPLTLERAVLANDGAMRPPMPEVAEKLWRAQFPETRHWQITSPFVAAHHFSLVALIRCEIQAIDQHWSLRRVAISLPDGALDESLGDSFGLVRSGAESSGGIDWPKSEPSRWHGFLSAALETDLASDLGAIRARQEQYLRRELDRVDDYFEHYERELTVRAARTGNENTKLKVSERLAAAQIEHARRRADQAARHEIRVHAHLDALLIVAEVAWRARITAEVARRPEANSVLFIPRTRRWVLTGECAG
jgi:hypothetical protein